MMSTVKKGMDVYDSTNNNFGSVQFIFTGEANTGSHPDDKWLPSGASVEDKQHLLQEGYIKVGNPIFSGGAYVLSSQIDRVEGDRVYTSVMQNEVLRD